MGETGVSCLRECRVVIVGATGAVGRVFLDLLPQRGYSGRLRPAVCLEAIGGQDPLHGWLPPDC